MRLFDFLFTNKKAEKRFVSEQGFENNNKNQELTTLQIMDQLRKVGVTPDKELKLEYFFYTNTVDKAQILAAEIQQLNYSVQHNRSAGNSNLFVITGWTIKMKMTDSIVAEWAKKMCELGYKFDCDFDGWGTSLEQ